MTSISSSTEVDTEGEAETVEVSGAMKEKPPPVEVLVEGAVEVEASLLAEVRPPPQDTSADDPNNRGSIINSFECFICFIFPTFCRHYWLAIVFSTITQALTSNFSKTFIFSAQSFSKCLPEDYYDRKSLNLR